MAPRKRRGVGRVKGSINPPPISTHAVNTCGFAALADEIYLEIVSYLPSVPIPTSDSIHLKSYPKIRRVRHETFLSLTQTSRSLRRFFWRYLWQRIEVREGMKIGDKYDFLEDTYTITRQKKYAIELVRQLEIVTIRNPLLAQYVNYLDIFIGQYSIDTVLAELARCLSLFPNLHTVQIDVSTDCRLRSLEAIFKKTFEKCLYPQIRNVFVMSLSASFIASCPQARRVGITRNCSMSVWCLQTILRNCPQLEVLDDLGDIFWTRDACNIVSNFPNLRSIQFEIYPLIVEEIPSHMYMLEKMNHLQRIIMTMPPSKVIHRRMTFLWHRATPEQRKRSDRGKFQKDWIKAAKRILIHIQLRDNLEKTIVVRDYDGSGGRQIVIKPTSSIEGSFT